MSDAQWLKQGMAAISLPESIKPLQSNDKVYVIKTDANGNLSGRKAGSLNRGIQIPDGGDIP